MGLTCTCKCTCRLQGGVNKGHAIKIALANNQTYMYSTCTCTYMKKSSGSAIRKKVQTYVRMYMLATINTYAVHFSRDIFINP